MTDISNVQCNHQVHRDPTLLEKRNPKVSVEDWEFMASAATEELRVFRVGLLASKKGQKPIIMNDATPDDWAVQLQLLDKEYVSEDLYCGEYKAGDWKAYIVDRYYIIKMLVTGTYPGNIHLLAPEITTRSLSTISGM